MMPRVAALTQEQQGEVQELAVAELTRQKERLAAYATQARFAVAQLYDRATSARDADRCEQALSPTSLACAGWRCRPRCVGAAAPASARKARPTTRRR